MEIVFAEKKHFEDIKQLWLNSFEDTKKYVDFFFNNMDFVNTANKILLYIKDNTIVSMMFLIKCQLIIDNKNNSGYYIFAVATDKNHKNKGYMRTLEDYAVTYLKSIQIDYIFLVPQTKELFFLYNKIGYNSSVYLGKHKLLNNNTKINNFAIDDITREDFIEKRESYYNRIKISLRIDDNFILNESIYEKKFLKTISIGDASGYIIGVKSNKRLTIVESDMTLEQLNCCCKNLYEYFNVEEIEFINHQDKNILYGCYKYIGKTEDIVQDKAYMNLMLL